MNEAIKLAIENGWCMPPRDIIICEPSWWPNDTVKSVVIPVYSFALDPLFWHALGKALEWGNGIGAIKEWQYHAHCYLDAKFENKEEEFWSDLLKEKKE